MSKWPNPSWNAPPVQGAPNTWGNPGKQPEAYTFVAPPQSRPYVVGAPIPSENEGGPVGASSPPKMAVPGMAMTPPLVKADPLAADEAVPRPMIQQQQPLPHMRHAYVNGGLIGPPMGQYAPMHMHPYQMAPPEYSTYGVYPAHGEQWEARPAMPGVAVGPELLHPAYDRRSSKESASSSPNTDTASVKDSDSSTAETLHALSGNKPTKRSRMGCLTCRQRKKRCCETRPQCTECQRLRLKCVWPKPGTEHKNKPKEVKCQENMIDHDVYGKIKVLRGIVEYRSD